MGELVLIDKCRHCEDGTIFRLWVIESPGESDTVSGTPLTALVTMVHRTVHELLDRGLLSPAALTMPVHDITHQFNNVNGGELWLTDEDETRPWVARRTELNSDGTEPEVWAFFVADEAEARMWLDAGQVDEIAEAP